MHGLCPVDSGCGDRTVICPQPSKNGIRSGFDFNAIGLANYTVDVDKTRGEFGQSVWP